MSRRAAVDATVCPFLGMSGHLGCLFHLSLDGSSDRLDYAFRWLGFRSLVLFVLGFLGLEIDGFAFLIPSGRNHSFGDGHRGLSASLGL